VVIEFISEYLTRYWIAFKAEVHDSSLVNRVASLLSNQRLKAFESLLRGKLVKEADLFDTKVDFLNVGNGIVNLRTKELLPHSPEWYFTKITPVNYKPNARHVDWLKVLEAIPSPVMEYVHSLLGQALTGRPPLEDVVAVFNGGGRNGKSTVTQVMVIVLGSFAVTVSDKILIARANDHSTDLTDLRGRRFALLEEFPDRVPLNGKRLKDITGTARITARRMRHDNESWAPTHTLVITTNHGIVVEAGDDGTWRRLVPIKFVYRFVKEPKGPLDRQIEEGLRERVYQGLEGQHEAALAWLIDGAFKWYSNGMKLPAQPKESKDELVEWRSGQDTLGTFLGETLEVSPGSVVLVNDLHNLYLAQNPDDLLHRTSAAFTSSLRSHEFFVTNALTTKRMRVNGIQLSRPNGFVIYEGLSPQPTCLIGVAFKN
jgi:P4 family phage/plasmid primase-like protien